MGPNAMLHCLFLMTLKSPLLVATKRTVQNSIDMFSGKSKWYRETRNTCTCMKSQTFADVIFVKFQR